MYQPQIREDLILRLYRRAKARGSPLTRRRRTTSRPQNPTQKERAMRDYIAIGPTPCEESCAQVGEKNYHEKALAECRRFLQLLRQQFGPEPAGAWLSIKWSPHDFGSYCEVVCHYHTDMQEAVDYALRCEAEMPETWEGDGDEPHA